MPPPAAPAPEEALRRTLRLALRQPGGRVVLRVEEPAPHRRRVARALLQEGALAAGGQVLDGPRGDLLLVGAEAGRAARLSRLLERLVGPAASRIFPLDRDGAALLAYAGGGDLPPERRDEGPALAGLDAFLDAMPLPRAIRRLHGVAPDGPGGPPAFLRLEPAREEIAAALGPLGADPDLLDHAAGRIAGRLMSALADPVQARGLLGAHRPQRLHLPLPDRRPAGPPAPPGRLVATLKLRDLARPGTFAARQAALAEAGIGVEVEGLDAAALLLLTPEALPEGLLRLRFSAELAAPPVLAALRLAGPARMILADAAGAAGRAFAAAQGFGLVEVPAS